MIAADPHYPNAVGVGWADGLVAVAKQITWRFIPGESVSHLTSDLPGSRIGSDANLDTTRPLATPRTLLRRHAETKYAIRDPIHSLGGPPSKRIPESPLSTNASRRHICCGGLLFYGSII